ncbi:MAG: hypothetical protein IT392_09230 [Nitrospirae bacterium]|nr:hypothetical protein [Nitrospirota bacterium]
MKTVIAVIILIAVIGAGGYFGLPLLIGKEMADLRTEVSTLKEKVQKIEAFVQSEEEIRKVTQLTPDSDTRKIVKTVNAISMKLNALEESSGKRISDADDAIRKQKAEMDAAMKSQTEALNKFNIETEKNLQRIQFEASMATIRSHILKVQVELQIRNVATAKAEMELLSDMFEKMGNVVPEENRKTIKDLHETLKKARGEIDSDLPAAINRINLLWHEMGKLLRKA